MTTDTPCRALHPVNPFKMAGLALLMHDGLQSTEFVVLKVLIMAITAVKGFASRQGYCLLVRKRLTF